jgi:hypothetical protein
MEYGFYHPDRGYWQTNSMPNADILSTYPDGTIEVPLQPSALHRFDGLEWVAPTAEEISAEMSRQVRANRDYILATVVDPLVSNPLRWGDLTTEQQQAWAAYRHALLDISQQSGFPTSVLWPEVPA